MNARIAFLKSYGLKFFDKVPAGYPYAGCVRYKKILPGRVRFLSAVVGPTWVLMGYMDAGLQHERLVHGDDEIEDFLLQYDTPAPASPTT